MMDTKQVKITVNVNIEGWTKDRVQELICTNDEALKRAIMLIDSHQTPDETMVGVTRHHNTVGWCMVDAKRGRRWAYWLRRGYPLREWEKPKVRSVMRKYWRQILQEIAIKKGYEVI